MARTLSRPEIEERLDAMIARQGGASINRLRDEARDVASRLGLDAEFEQLNLLIGALLGTREAAAVSAPAKTWIAGLAYDHNRIRLFKTLFGVLRDSPPEDRPTPPRDHQANGNLSFFEAYFSNFIDGTEFTVDEPAEIVFDGVISQERRDDAHDVVGTFRIVSDTPALARLPDSFGEFVGLLCNRHAQVMEARPDKRPGEFKSKGDHAGSTIFVAPDLVRGTLARAYEFMQGLAEPLRRAVYMMVLVSEVHPFVDGNDRVARIMINAELAAGKQERIIIPTAYRTDYLGVLKAFSQNGHVDPLIRMLDVAQRYTGSIVWSTLQITRRMLADTNAFATGENARMRFRWADGKR